MTSRGEIPLRLDKDQIKDILTLDDIRKILDDLGSKEPKEDTDGNLIFQTVCHGGTKHKLYYYKDSKTFHCYTDCGLNYDIYNLVIAAKKQQGYNYSFYDAIRYVADITGNHYYERGFGRGFGQKQKDEKIEDWNWLNKFQKPKKLKIELPIYDESILEVFLDVGYEPWEEEGISLETQKMYGIRYYIKNDSVIIPHYDINGNLVGIRQRNTRQEELDEGRKYTPVIIENKMYNHPLGMNLYGLHKTKKGVAQSRKLMLFEGEKSVYKAQEYYGDMNFTCALGSNNITIFQRDIVLSLGVEEVFIALDKYSESDDEEKVQKYKNKLYNFAKMFSPYCRSYILWDNDGLLDYKDSPVDKGKEVLEILMKNKYEIGTMD